MRWAVALVLTLVANAVLAQGLLAQRSVNYCAAKMCGHTNAHTFCQFQPGPSERCRGYMDAHLTNEEKVRVVARLNRRRSEAASGRLRRLPPAGNMLKLRWVEELAREAQRWADQCRPPRTPDERDACRDLYSTTVGQCVASVVGEAPGLRVESMVDMWYMQSILYKGNVTSYMIPMSNVTFYGDFAQMIWARSYMVGCGRSRFMSELNGRLRSVERLVCNFAPRGPVQSRALWIPAAPATACPARSMPDPELTTLCNFPETVREIQEALDRMERNLEEIRSTPGKVRRELRDVPPPPDILDNTQPPDPVRHYRPAVQNAGSDQNKTDRGPMLNMVLKYMPYLKPYENEILGSSTSSGVSLAVSYVWFSFEFLLMCV
ncbi:venom allergen 3-like [Ostrinia nubilalis]|uniref:venom allergen 3-like n=1 Tax=Ostrinia nubilalis TaxID=29057 RepID=UPI00308247F2